MQNHLECQMPPNQQVCCQSTKASIANGCTPLFATENDKMKSNIRHVACIIFSKLRSCVSCDDNREHCVRVQDFKYPFCGRVTRMGPFFGTEWSLE